MQGLPKQRKRTVEPRPTSQVSDVGSYHSNVSSFVLASSPSLKPLHSDSLDEYRASVKKLNDPEAIFEFALHLISTAQNALLLQVDTKGVRKYQDSLCQEALKWLKKLSQQGGIPNNKSPFPEAQFTLAGFYGNGSLGLSIDHEKAFNLYIQASKQNHPAATYRTAVCYEVGAGTKRDNARALQFFRKAAALGDPSALYKYGMILLNGTLGCITNPREGLTWLKRAAARADEASPHSLHELGVLYESSSELSCSAGIVPDPVYAYDLFLRAGQLGYSPAQYKLGLSFEYGIMNLNVNPRRSIAWYTRAAQQGDPDAELALSGWYLTGSEGILVQSTTEAYLWARKAADKGLAKAEFAVAYYTENGIGVMADMDEARKWYLRAAAQGNKRAVSRINELKEATHSRSSKSSKATSDLDRVEGSKSDCSIM